MISRCPQLGDQVAKRCVSIVVERSEACGLGVEFCPTHVLARMVLNSVMVGLFTAVTKLLSADAVRKAVADSVPANFRELNLKAFEKGFEYGSTVLAMAPARHEWEELAVTED